PWKELVAGLLKNFQLPLWNPYNFAGTPLLANIQSSVFYPLNLIFLLPSFPLAWSIYILIAPVLSTVFMFLYLRNLNLQKIPAVFGAIVFALCGFNIAWLENGVLTHTLLWLPLILLSIDRKKYLVYLIAILSSFFAGHWQTFLYVFIFSHIYLIFRNIRSLPKFLILDSIFLILSLPQLLPSLQFISLSARNTDQMWTNVAGWFIPWQNLIQFISPDFFGNPSTLNYTGIFSYQEFIGYIGVPGIIFVASALFIKRKIIWFFAGAAIIGLLFALPTPLAKLPFILNLPFISSSMPTRLLSIIGFCLAVLAAFGFQKINKKITAVFVISFALLWLLFPTKYLILPTALLVATLVIKKYPWLLVLLLIFDLGRFAVKFLPFSDSKYLYPDTKVTKFLQENTKDYTRFMTLNDEIFPPNFNIVYRLQSINGYDPLYLKSYSDLVGGGNRIIVPKDYKNPIINLLGVKYILTFENINDPNYPLAFQEGKTKVFENKKVQPRAFVENGTAKIISYTENKVIIKTESTSPAILTLTDMYYPTWKAYIDDIPTKITPTPENLRSILVPAGIHEIIFEIRIL
ncbi:MAG: hypothetical protein AAB506_00835, partial [Patescibacteria group bacterium]